MSAPIRIPEGISQNSSASFQPEVDLTQGRDSPMQSPRSTLSSIQDSSAVSSATTSRGVLNIANFSRFVNHPRLSATSCHTFFNALSIADQAAVEHAVWMAAGSPADNPNFGRDEIIRDIKGPLVKAALANPCPSPII